MEMMPQGVAQVLRKRLRLFVHLRAQSLWKHPDYIAVCAV